MTLVLSLGTMIPMRQPQSEDHQRIVECRWSASTMKRSNRAKLSVGGLLQEASHSVFTSRSSSR